VTPVGSESHHASLGLILPTSLDGEVPATCGRTQNHTAGTTTGGATADSLSELCRQAEACGADSLWAVDHLYWPHPIAEALTTLAVAATVTEGVTLGTCVLQLPLRRADAVAKQATALQLLSGGRMVLGLGVGSHRGEYEEAGVDFGRRGALMDEGVGRLRTAWSSADAGTGYVQSPVSRAVPLWFGGASPPARRRAAAVGDGWIPLFLTPDEYAAALGDLRSETAARGRDPGAVEAGIVVFARVGDDADAPDAGAAWLSALYRMPPKAFARHLVAGSPERCAAALRRYAEAGARHILVMVAGPGSLDQFAALRRAFARPILAEVSA
jgi:alkanesulfonate monooxygenase SsuD/methylene tetrahydromethanopterin reductase-like flavin-dependent oxidoreductase (luciferase family)